MCTRAIPVNFDVPEGEQVPGSAYRRVYCIRCGEPMRVTYVQAEWGEYPRRIRCECCRGRKLRGVGNSFYLSDEDANGSWANVVKAYENMAG